MKQQELIEGTHFYINDDGNMVFTKQYHLEKGICCGLGCLHCPYNYENVTPKPCLPAGNSPSRNNRDVPKGGFEETPE